MTPTYSTNNPRRAQPELIWRILLFNYAYSSLNKNIKEFFNKNSEINNIDIKIDSLNDDEKILYYNYLSSINIPNENARDDLLKKLIQETIKYGNLKLSLFFSLRISNDNIFDDVLNLILLDALKKNDIQFSLEIIKYYKNSNIKKDASEKVSNLLSNIFNNKIKQININP